MLVKKRIHFLISLTEIESKQAKLILKTISKPEINSISEIFLNILQKTLSISKELKSQFNSHKTTILKLVDRRTPLTTRKKLMIKHHALLLKTLKAVRNQLHPFTH